MTRDETNYGIAKRSLHGHNHFVSDVVISSDGQFALSGSWDSTLRLWDLSTSVTLLALINVMLGPKQINPWGCIVVRWVLSNQLDSDGIYNGTLRTLPLILTPYWLMTFTYSPEIIRQNRIYM